MEHHEFLAGIGVGYKKWLSAYNTRNISKMRQNRAKVTINCLYKVTHELTADCKMHDLEWPLTETQRCADHTGF